MNSQALEHLIEETVMWYSKKGKAAKRLSIATRLVVWCFATAAILSMTVGGATSITVILAVIGASAIGLDRLFSFTRNWSEFSLVEVKLRVALATVRFHAQNGPDDGSVQRVFKEAMALVEKETKGWGADVTTGIESLKKEVGQLASK